MSNKGYPAWNRGKKFPHTKEWEEKRLAATRAAANIKQWPRGYKRPKEQTQPMLDALHKKMKENPEKYRTISINNLPKDCNGDKNGNWKGGITVASRGIRMTKEYKLWRDGVLNRDGKKCRLCQSTSELQAHHIIPISECLLIATLPMNGVTLCKKCHYENDECWQGKRHKRSSSDGKILALIFTIPHKFQAYPTIGNWQYTKSGAVVIFVSKMKDQRHETLVALHELVEVMICRHRGISQKSVDRFDMEYEKHRDPKDVESEPGDDPKAPYADQHCVATGIERILAQQLGVKWNEYTDEIESLP